MGAQEDRKYEIECGIICVEFSVVVVILSYFEHNFELIYDEKK